MRCQCFYSAVMANSKLDYCFASVLRAFLLNFFCYDLKVFHCGHSIEQVISLTEAQICRILITLELKVQVVFSTGREKLHVARIWVGGYNSELCIPVHRRVTSSFKLAGTRLHTRVERGTVRVKCLAQDPGKGSNQDDSIPRRWAL